MRAQVVAAWETAISESEFDHISNVPWWPPHEAVVGSYELVAHVRDVLQCALTICDSLTTSQSSLEIRRDDLVAGALLHDVSKPFEMVDGALRSDHELLPHPHYSVYLLAKCDLSTHIQHIVLAHSGLSGVTPQTLEAKIVSVADTLAVDALYWTSERHLKPES
ncbi:HD domain-containing protein [Haloferax sp. ATB1]|uniref:HD domain-containing protein n=1 Tax=Haloferax sp. ATB1 TaxID=1508454 RepID=UPI000AD87D78|nr:HD domain-containing protein [Haloferax sp. ATB1]